MSSPEGSQIPIGNALPNWPSRDYLTPFWIALNREFRFTHHASNETKISGQLPGGTAFSNEDQSADYYCPNDALIADVKSHLLHSKGGSLLVTGYRGTGKTSLVYEAVSQACEEFEKLQPDRKMIPVTINLSAVSGSTHVLYLLYHALHQLIKKGSLEWEEDEKTLQLLGDERTGNSIRNRVHQTMRRLRAEVTEHEGQRGAALDSTTGRFHPPDTTRNRKEITFGKGSLISADEEEFRDIINCLGDCKLEDRKSPRFVFITDELDKLPVEGIRQSEKQGRERFVELQRVVSDLKFLLSEGNSHQIFIAGKDVDDSWHQDENKREGLFESIFARNVYLPSLFRSQLKPPTIYASVHGDADKTSDAEKDGSAFYRNITSVLGIPRRSLTYNTALLILPHFAPYELLKLLRRNSVEPRAIRCQCKKCQGALNRVRAEFDPNEAKAKQGSSIGDAWTQLLKCEFARDENRDEVGLDFSELDPGLHSAFAKATERSIRRLRIFLQYLTYKGRGIPRKVLREFYRFVRHRSVVGDHYSEEYWSSRDAVNIVSIEQHDLQRMGFYADIVEHLERNFDRFRQLNDKGRVSAFHIIDYILKFHSTGFTADDIAHARFVTTRQEVFPSQLLAQEVIEMLEGRLIRRKDRRSSEYRLLPRISHDLLKLLRDYSAEQIEIRFADADYEEEKGELEAILENVENSTPEQRLESTQAQIWLGVIEERLGRPFNARLAYSKAARWLRMDLQRFEEIAARREPNPTEIPAVSKEFMTHFISYIVPVLHRLGRMHEEYNDFHNALQCYDEAIRLHHLMTGFSPKKNRPVPKKWPYGKELFHLMSSPGELREALLFTRKELRFTEGIRPMASEGAPEGLANSYNLMAIAREKMWERSAANQNFIRALNYLHSVNDEYGVVDQMFFIGQVMMRRRDLRCAALWYLQALSLIEDIHENADDPRHSGWKWSTAGYQASVHAQLLSYLGDVVFATGGLAVFAEENLETNSSDADGERFFWLGINRYIRRYVPYERCDEYFYAHSRILFEASGDVANSVDVMAHQMHVRGTRLINLLYATVGADAGDESRDSQWYDLVYSWNGFWRGIKGLLFRLLDNSPHHARDNPNSWGTIRDRRRLAAVFVVASQVLKEISLVAADPLKGGRAVLAHYIGAAVRDLDRGRLSPVRLLIGEAEDSLFPDENWQNFRDRLKEVRISRRKDLVEWDVIPHAEEFGDSDERAAEGNEVIADSQQALLAIFGYLNGAVPDTRPDENETIEKFILKPPVQSSILFQISSRIEDDSSRFEIGEIYHQIRSLAEKSRFGDTAPRVDLEILSSNLLLLAMAERAALSGFLIQRDMIENVGSAECMVNLGELYFIAIYHLCGMAPSLSESWEDFPNCLLRLHLCAKRFLVKAIDTFNDETRSARTTCQLKSEAFFTLGDLLLIRSAWIEAETDERAGLFGTLNSLTPEFQKDRCGANFGSEIGDLEPRDVRRQVMDYYQSGLHLTMQELDDFSGRFRLPPDVFHAHRNVIDPLLHFDIAKSVRRRSADAERETSDSHVENHLGNLRALTEAGRMFLRPRNTFKSWSDWKRDVRPIWRAAERYRPDRSPIQFDKDQRLLQWRTELPRRNRFSYFSFGSSRSGS